MARAGHRLLRTVFDLPRRVIGPRAEFIAARWPFVWHTRLYLWAIGGLVVAALAAAYGAAAYPTLADVPGVDEITSVLSAFTFIGYTVILLMAVDIVRRAPTTFSLAQSVSFAACVAAAAALILLPEYMQIRAGLSRIAALDSEAHVAAMLKLHKAHGFYKCRSDREFLAGLIAEHGDEIRRDLQQYGFDTSLAISGSTCVDPLVELQVWSAGLPPAADYTALGRFESRVLSVDAAQRYFRGDVNPFETSRAPGIARELFGTEAIAPPIPATLWQLLLIAVVVGILTAIVVGSRLALARAVQAFRSWFSVVRRYLPAVAPLDRLLSTRWPTLWAARIHTSLVRLVLLVFLTVAIGMEVVTGPEAVLVAAPALIVTLFLSLRSQEHVRHLSLNLSREITVFVMHAVFMGAVFGMFALALGSGFGSSTEEVIDNVTLVSWLALSASGGFQAARSGTAILASISLVTAWAGFGGAVVLAATVFGYSIFNLESAVSIAALLELGIIALIMVISRRWESRPAVRRVILGTFLTTAPVVGALCLLGTWGTGSHLSLRFAIVSVAAALALTALCLRLSEGYRRRLSVSSR